MRQSVCRELLLTPNLISLTRLLFAACFPFAVGNPPVATAILILAGISDVLDGWLARKHGLTTVTGAVLDPLTDKAFVLTVAVTLIVSGQLSIVAVALLSLREIAELPLLIWLLVSRNARSARAQQPSANVAGKLTTSLQFVTILWALFHAPLLWAWVAITAAAAAGSAFVYWRRALVTVNSP